MKERTIQLTNRHSAKLLDKLDEINAASIIKDCVKAHVWWLVGDLSKEQDNGEYRITNR